MKKLVKPSSIENSGLYLYEGYCTQALLQCWNQCSQAPQLIGGWCGIGCGIGYLMC